MTSFLKRVINKIERETVLFFLQLTSRLEEIELDQILKQEISVKPPIMEDFCLPYNDMSNPFFAHDDYTPLIKLIRAKGPKKILELGTAHGNTVANICNNIEEAVVYTVNALEENLSGYIVTFELSKSEIGKVYRAHEFSSRVHQIFENTLTMDLSKYIQKESIDFAIIDACHDTEYVLNDFLKILPYLKKDAVVLFHDTHPSMERHLIGSYKACMILRWKGYKIKHIRNTWWGYWIKPE